jgi:hypothetical protein
MTDSAAHSSPDACEDLRVLYQVTAQDLVFFKQQQWATTNYVLLVHAGLVAVTQSMQAKPVLWERIGISILSAVVGAVGMVLIAKLELSIKARRERLQHVRARLSPEFRDAWQTPAKAPDSPGTVWVLVSAMLVGVTIVLRLVWR